MRFTVSSEELKLFQTQGYFELEDLLTEEEAVLLVKDIHAVRLKIPGYPEENFFRSIPFIVSLAKKRGWGQVAAELLRKKPLRLCFDKFFLTAPHLIEAL